MTPMADDEYAAEVIRRAAAAELRRQNAIIDAACLRASATSDPACGVLVVYRGAELVSAEPDPSVPYGELHERQQVIG